MKRLMGGVALATVGAGAAFAGGVERTVMSSAILFEQGTYAELTFASVSPKVTGKTETSPLALLFPVGAGTGDVSNDYTTTTVGFKTELGEKMHVALFFEQPIGADVIYDEPDYLYGFGGGSTATIDSQALTALLRYELPKNFSVYGGLRYEEAEGEVDLFDLFGLSDYTMNTNTAKDWGYVLGVAWEKPEIAARVALTYVSAITHTFKADEVQDTTTASTTFDTEVPQSLTLEFQTGVAADTLLFGSVRWVDWTEFDITPELYTNTLGGSLVSYDNDVITYELGLGRRFNERWSGAVTLGYEKAQGGFSANLGPTDGYVSLGLGGTYTMRNIEISGGASYIWIGDAKTESPVTDGATLGKFDGNSGYAVGMKIAYNF